jgi:hypothetical protein
MDEGFEGLDASVLAELLRDSVQPVKE